MIKHTQNRYLIIGQGSIGKPVAERLAKMGHQVTAMARTPKHHESAVHFWQKDAKSLTACELVEFSHIAIIITPNRQDDDRVRAYRESYLAVCEHMAELHLPNLCRILFVSSTSVYGENQGERVDIHTNACPSTQTAKILWQAENTLTEVFGERCVIVRPSGIYEASSTRMRELAKNAHVSGASMVHYTNRIHRDDLIDVLCRLMTLPVCEPLYLVSDCQPASRFDVLDFLCQKYGYPKPLALEGSPSGKRIYGNVEDWIRFKTYKMGYQGTQKDV